MPLRQCASRLAGRISPARVSASSSAYSTTTKSSSGSRDSLVGRGSSNTGSTILLLMAESPFVELEVGPRAVKVTNPDKVFFRARGETKLDLVQYYLAVGEGIVRVLYERPTQLKRHPDGAEGEAIYQKRVPKHRPDWIETATVTFPSGRTADELGFVGWPKTSGNRGIHVACRIEPKWGFREVRRCALAFAREIERRAPKLVTTAWWKEERGERVFIDYNQNARDRTIASAYSVRARPDATISAPFRWD